MPKRKLQAIWIILIGVLILAFFLFGIRSAFKDKLLKKENSGYKTHPGGGSDKGFAFIELFTSEGCSSCPPADELVAQLSKEGRKNVFILGYHVDYWDQLGWKDKFSNAAWTERQQKYITRLGLGSAYTPQIILNGVDEFVGSDRERLYRDISKYSADDEHEKINISARVIKNSVEVNYQAPQLRGCMIYFALIQTIGSSQVKGGENHGKYLEHINIVSNLKSVTPGEKQNQISFPIPSDFSLAGNKIVAFLQRNNDYRILAATECAIN
jgi:hypothetical protein